MQFIWAASITVRKLAVNYLDNQLIVSVTFQAEVWNISWFQILRFKDLLLFFVTYDSK